MKEPTDRPRLVFRGGYWRVSPLPDRSARSRSLWAAAHLHAFRLNEKGKDMIPPPSPPHPFYWCVQSASAPNRPIKEGSSPDKEAANSEAKFQAHTFAFNHRNVRVHWTVTDTRTKQTVARGSIDVWG